MTLRVGSLFSGIGGWDLGLERAGMHVVWQAEAHPWCRAVLRHHWPDVPCFHDVRDITDCAPIDILCGGFPCQPVSLAGLGRAQGDERWLWPEFARLVRLLRPRYVLVENVPGLLARGMGDVLGDLAALRYDAEWGCIRAADVGAPHLRERVWIVAYPDARRLQECGERNGRPAQPGQQAPLGNDADGLRSDVADAHAIGWDGRPRVFGQGWGRELADGRQWEPEPDVGRVADGVPRRVDRIAGLGNALIPQIAEWLGRRIIDYEEGRLDAAA